jgi:DNA-3-methyladenine glycosylase I
MHASLSHLTRAVFSAGLDPDVVDRRWPAFEAAFAGFDPAAVAAFGPEDVDRLLHDPGIVRNRRKIEATVRNARTLLELGRPLPDWLAEQDDPEAALREGFAGVGPRAAAHLVHTLRQVGV